MPSQITQRQFQTTVELREGQTLTVAGLIQNNFSGTSNRVPFWGDLPLIGRTGGVDSLSSGEQELVVLVTPVLVHPLEQCQTPPLPGNNIFEPGDVEFYLWRAIGKPARRGLPGFGPHRLRPPNELLRVQRPVHHRPARHDLRLLQIGKLPMSAARREQSVCRRPAPDCPCRRRSAQNVQPPTTLVGRRTELPARCVSRG